MSDTSPITNLIQIGKLDLLKVLFGKVIIPQKIYLELSEYENQQVVVDRNDWIEVRTIEREEEVGLLQKELDDGEAEAIVLAKEVNAHFLIVDERKGRLVAQSHGIRVIGLLGVLLQAKKAGHIPRLKPLLNQLIHEAGFRVSPELYRRILLECDELSIE